MASSLFSFFIIFGLSETNTVLLWPEQFLFGLTSSVVFSPSENHIVGKIIITITCYMTNLLRIIGFRNIPYLGVCYNHVLHEKT